MAWEKAIHHILENNVSFCKGIIFTNELSNLSIER